MENKNKVLLRNLPLITHQVRYKFNENFVIFLFPNIKKFRHFAMFSGSRLLFYGKKIKSYRTTLRRHIHDINRMSGTFLSL